MWADLRAVRRGRPGRTTQERLVPRQVVVGNLGYDVSFTLPKCYSVADHHPARDEPLLGGAVRGGHDGTARRSAHTHPTVDYSRPSNSHRFVNGHGVADTQGRGSAPGLDSELSGVPSPRRW